MKKITLIFASMLTLGASVQAQTRFGLEAGVNLASVHSKYDLPGGAEYNETSDMKAGFRIGAIADIGVSNHLFIRPGVFFSQLGGKFDGTVESKLTYNYIQVPVNILYKLGEDGGGRFYFGLVPYVGFAIGGKVKIGKVESDLEVGDDPLTDDVKALDFGGGVKVGYELPFGLHVDAAFMQGLANTLPTDDDDAKSSNRVITIGVGYLFGHR